MIFLCHHSGLFLVAFHLFFSKYFQIFYVFAQIFKYFAFFALFCIYFFFWKILHIPLFSRIGPTIPKCSKDVAVIIFFPQTDFEIICLYNTFPWPMI